MKTNRFTGECLLCSSKIEIVDQSEGGVLMTRNVGGIERPLRIIVGILAFGIGAFAGLPVAVTATAFAVGAIALVSGAIGYCPLWSALGINTCPTTSKHTR
jgi:Protein of unknown function (DUF2892)